MISAQYVPSLIKVLTGLTLGLALAACDRITTESPELGAESASAPQTEPAAPPSTSDAGGDSPSEPDAPTAPTASLAPGDYCYTADTESLTGVVRLTVAESDQIRGDSSVSIHDEEASYYTSYGQKFEGDLAGTAANLDITTWIEYDRQTEAATWTVTSETLTVDDTIFTRADCAAEAVLSLFRGPTGLTAADLLEDISIARQQQVQFAPGTSGTALENSVVRGDRDLYSLGARGGQSMTLEIDALEDNAAFALISPSGYLLLHDATSENILLPQTGDYTIIVGSTRGNASYTLEVSIE